MLAHSDDQALDGKAKHIGTRPTVVVVAITHVLFLCCANDNPRSDLGVANAFINTVHYLLNAVIPRDLKCAFQRFSDLFGERQGFIDL